MTLANRDNSGNPARWWTLALALSGLCLVFRAPALLAMPIFGDEAIYLRWAQLIRPDGGGHWWVSLCDPKPPLHFWLIAAILKWARDPLAAARMTSVLSGVLSVPAIMLVSGEIAGLARSGRPALSGRALGLLAAVLMIFCPFLAFYQRLATADALFVLEMLAATWLSLRWARLAMSGRRAWPAALALGTVLGCALLTRQGLSYTLCGMPVAALALHALRHRLARKDALSPTLADGRHLKVAIAQWALAMLIAAALWSPYLAAHFQTNAAENGGPSQELKRRILYQGQFTQGDESRMALALRNCRWIFIPHRASNHDGAPAAAPDSGWLFLYMTPAVYLACLLGLIYLAAVRQWYIFTLLLVWLVLMLGPLILLGNVLYSRYLVPAVIPLLIAAAWLIGDTLSWLFSRRWPQSLCWSLTAVVLGGVLIMPLAQIGGQAKNWNKQRLTEPDRYQYLTGWTSGWAARGAIRVLTMEAAKGPVIVITDAGWGNPADAAWVYLSGLRNVTLYYTTPTDAAPMILTPAPGAPANTFLLRSDKFLFTPPRPVAIPAGRPVFYITNDPVYTATGAAPAEEFFRAKNPNLGPPLTFYGIGGADAPPDRDRVLVFPVQ